MVVNVDHHPDNRRYGHVNWIDTGAAATGEMVYRLLVGLGLPLTPAIATNLFTAIHTDTGSFRYSNVTPETFRIAAELVAAGAEPAVVSSALYERRPTDALRWLGESLARVQVSEDGRVAWLALPSGAVPETFIESEELVNYPRSIASVRVACLLRERGGTVKVSLRGKGDVDVNRIAARFGGGGHPNAAGCTVPGALAAVTRDVLAAVHAAMRGGRRRRSRPGHERLGRAGRSTRPPGSRRSTPWRSCAAGSASSGSATPARSTPTPPACCRSCSAKRPS